MPPRPLRVLIIEDDHGIGANLQRAIASDTVDADWAKTVADADRAASRCPPDVVLLDLGLPDGDGLDLCTKLLARQPALPIIMLTARSSEIDTVVGLDAGAVDYVTKPFRLAELLARVRAHLRRVAPSEDVVSVGAVHVDRAARTVRVGDVPVELRAKEFDLLDRLTSGAGIVVRREDLMSDVWDEHWFGSTKTLDVTVASLRRKLDDAGPGLARITTVRGVGYRFEAP